MEKSYFLGQGFGGTQWVWDGDQLPYSWQRLVLGTLTLISIPWGVPAMGCPYHGLGSPGACLLPPLPAWEQEAVAGPLWPVPAIWLGDQRENRLTNAQSEAFNPAIGDATSFSGASTRPARNPGAAWGQPGEMPPLCGGQPSSVAKRNPEQRWVLPFWHPLMSQHHPMDHSALSILEVGRAVPALASLHPRPTVVHADAPNAQPLFWTFCAGQKGYFYRGLQGDDSQLPIFASTCPGEVSWQVGSSQAGGGEQGQGSHEMLQPPFWAETLQYVAKTQGCCWGGLRVSLLGQAAVLQRAAPISGLRQANPKPLLTRGEPGCSPPAHCEGFCRDLSLA